jgi:hypothetical protein
MKNANKETIYEKDGMRPESGLGEALVHEFSPCPPFQEEAP